MAASGLDTSLRELTGGQVLCRIGGFVELEAAVAATTAIRHLSTIADAALGVVMPFPGCIVAMSGASEAGSNFTIQPTIDATPDTTKTMTMDSAAEYVVYDKGARPAFTAGQALGMYCVADTTSKDFTGSLWVLFDLSAL